MERFRLTAEEVLIIELLFVSIESQSNLCLFNYYKLPIEQTKLRQVLVTLQNKGVILKSCNLPKEGEPFDRDIIMFNDLFLRFYRKTSGELFEELQAAYPNEAIIKGQAVTLKNWGKRFNSEQEIAFYYGKTIGWNLDKHKRVLSLIQWSKDNDHFGLNMNMADFIISQMWNSIEAHKDGEGVITFDTTISI